MKFSAQTLAWLTEENNPSVRYFTMKDLLGMPGNHPDLVRAKADILESHEVRSILAAQHDSGYWGEEDRFYTDKYRGTVWQLLILAELGVPPVAEIRKGCEFLLGKSQGADGGFSVTYGKRIKAGLLRQTIPCLTGNMTWAMIRFGYLEDPRIQRAIDWIVRNQRADDGERPDLPDWDYNRHTACFSGHSCFMGVVKSLKALAAIPEDVRSAAVRDKIRELAEYLLIHHVFKKSHDLAKVAKPGWKRFGFPLMYQTDILEIMLILTDLGIRDPRMEEAAAFIMKEQTEPERWKLKNSFNGKMIVDIEEKGEISKWITLRALKVLCNL